MEGFGAREAFENDSAKAGASAVDAAGNRALEAELASGNGSSTIVLLRQY